MLLRILGSKQEIYKLQMETANPYSGRTSVSFRGGLHFGGELNVLVYDSSVIRRLTSFPVKEVDARNSCTSPCTMTPGAGRSFGASDGKRTRVGCKYKQELFVTHGVAKPVSTWRVNLQLLFFV
jgi:hypothetical protein